MSDNEHYQLCPSPNTKKKRPNDYDDCIFTSSSKMSRVDKGKNDFSVHSYGLLSPFNNPGNKICFTIQFRIDFPEDVDFNNSKLVLTVTDAEENTVNNEIIEVKIEEKEQKLSAIVKLVQQEEYKYLNFIISSDKSDFKLKLNWKLFHGSKVGNFSDSENNEFKTESIIFYQRNSMFEDFPFYSQTNFDGYLMALSKYFYSNLTIMNKEHLNDIIASLESSFSNPIDSSYSTESRRMYYEAYLIIIITFMCFIVNARLNTNIWKNGICDVDVLRNLCHLGMHTSPKFEGFINCSPIVFRGMQIQATAWLNNFSAFNSIPFSNNHIRDVLNTTKDNLLKCSKCKTPLVNLYINLKDEFPNLFQDNNGNLRKYVMNKGCGHIIACASCVNTIDTTKESTEIECLRMFGMGLPPPDCPFSLQPIKDHGLVISDQNGSAVTHVDLSDPKVKEWAQRGVDLTHGRIAYVIKAPAYNQLYSASKYNTTKKCLHPGCDCPLDPSMTVRYPPSISNHNSVVGVQNNNPTIVLGPTIN